MSESAPSSHHRLLLIVPTCDAWANALVLMTDWHVLEGVDLFFADYLPGTETSHQQASEQPVYQWHLADFLRRGATIVLSAEAPAFLAVPSLLPFWNAQCIFPSYLPDDLKPLTLHQRVSSLTDWIFEQCVPRNSHEKPEIIFCRNLLQALEAAPAGYATPKQLSMYRSFKALPDLRAARELLDPFMPPNPVNLPDIEGIMFNGDPQRNVERNLEARPMRICDGDRFDLDVNFVSMTAPDQEILWNAARNSRSRCALAISSLPHTLGERNLAAVTRVYVMTLPSAAGQEGSGSFLHAYQLAAVARHALYMKEFVVAWVIRGTRFMACFDVLGEISFHPELFHFGSRVLGAQRVPLSYFDAPPASIAETLPPATSSREVPVGEKQEERRAPTDYQRRFAAHYVATKPIENYADGSLARRPDNYFHLLTQAVCDAVNGIGKGSQPKEQ